VHSNRMMSAGSGKERFSFLPGTSPDVLPTRSADHRRPASSVTQRIDRLESPRFQVAPSYGDTLIYAGLRPLATWTTPLRAH
jgi:hypothetical protein